GALGSASLRRAGAAVAAPLLDQLRCNAARLEESVWLAEINEQPVVDDGDRGIEMKIRRLERSGLTALLLLALVVGGAAAPAARSSDRNPDPADSFRAMMNDAVARMHAAMEVPFTGDADRDFARMMIPHHQGAIDMALVELRYGKDERLKRLAQEIIVAQQ